MLAKNIAGGNRGMIYSVRTYVHVRRWSRRTSLWYENICLISIFRLFITVLESR